MRLNASVLRYSKIHILKCSGGILHQIRKFFEKFGLVVIVDGMDVFIPHLAPCGEFLQNFKIDLSPVPKTTFNTIFSVFFHILGSFRYWGEVNFEIL